MRFKLSFEWGRAYWNERGKVDWWPRFKQEPSGVSAQQSQTTELSIGPACFRLTVTQMLGRGE